MTAHVNVRKKGKKVQGVLEERQLIGLLYTDGRRKKKIEQGKSTTGTSPKSEWGGEEGNLVGGGVGQIWVTGTRRKKGGTGVSDKSLLNPM